METPNPSARKPRPNTHSAAPLGELQRQLDATRMSLAVARQKHRQLKATIVELTQALTSSRGSRPAKLIPLQSFAPEPYDLLRPLQVVVEASGDEFTACFPDANLTAYGDNEHEAVEHLKVLILDVFDDIASGRKLGPGPAKQLAVLSEFLRKRG